MLKELSNSYNENKSTFKKDGGEFSIMMLIPEGKYKIIIYNRICIFINWAKRDLNK